MNHVITTHGLTPVSAEACLVFHQSLGTLTDDVNREMEGRPDLPHLIGCDNIALMKDNHGNHAAFMDNVFFLGSFTLLARMVPWVYRVYTARGFSLDYFPAELQAWARAIENRIPPACAKPILDVYAWMIEQHSLFAELAQAPEAIEPTHIPAIDLDRFLEVFLKGDFQAAERLAKESLGDQPDLEGLYLWILDPVMREMGRRWEKALITSAQEHIASALVTRMMSVAYAKVDVEPTLGKRAVVCSGPHEQHQIGAWMVSDLLELRGWDARLLGANPYAEDLLSLLNEYRPMLLALSVTMPFHLREATQLIATLRKIPELRGMKVLVGGSAFALDPTLPAAIGADGYAPDARSAALLADHWFEEFEP